MYFDQFEACYPLDIMSSIGNVNISQWPFRDCQGSVKVTVIPLSEHALSPTCRSGEPGMDIYSPYGYLVGPFRTIQVHTDLVINFPSQVNAKFYKCMEDPSTLMVARTTVPSNYGKGVEVTVTKFVGQLGNYQPWNESGTPCATHPSTDCYINATTFETKHVPQCFLTDNFWTPANFCEG